MSEMTGPLDNPAVIDRGAAADLLPLVYDQLRRLAAHGLADEGPGPSLDATALVHEAYPRLVGSSDGVRWDGRGHYVAAAAQAMQRVLVDRARGRARTKRGGDRRRVRLVDIAGRVDTTRTCS
jgi:RNA polymerase sigma factor (TIGR02999 family)